MGMLTSERKTKIESPIVTVLLHTNLYNTALEEYAKNLKEAARPAVSCEA